MGQGYRTAVARVTSPQERARAGKPWVPTVTCTPDPGRRARDGGGAVRAARGRAGGLCAPEARRAERGGPAPACGLPGENFLERACGSLSLVATRPWRGPGRRRGMQALNITPERFSRLLRDHNLTREQFIALYGLRPLVYTPELPAGAKLALVLTGVLIFALALFGNALVVYVVTRSKAMRTVTNIFICSLALSDLLIAFFCIPVTMLQNVSDTWLGGESPSRAPAPSPRVSSTPRYRPGIGVLGLFSILLHGVDCQ